LYSPYEMTKAHAAASAPKTSPRTALSSRFITASVAVDGSSPENLQGPQAIGDEVASWIESSTRSSSQGGTVRRTLTAAVRDRGRPGGWTAAWHRRASAARARSRAAAPRRRRVAT
jgi:hypothetical protein